MKQICRAFGIATYQTLCKSHEPRLAWVDVEENQNKVGHTSRSVETRSVCCVCYKFL